MKKSQVQSEVDQLLKELADDLNTLLPEQYKCEKLLFQEIQGKNWVGRFQGTRNDKQGIYQFVVNLPDETVSVGEEIS